MTFPLSPWLLLPALALALLALARLGRLRPAWRPLVRPFAWLVLGVVLLLAGAPHGPARPVWVLVLVGMPALVLGVRAVVLAFTLVFRRSRGQAPPALLDSLVSVVLYALGLGVAARVFLGLELTPFLAGSAVVGAVVGLALQDTLGNLFAGIALHTEGPFRVGDWVRLGPTEGRVEQISWRAVRLRTWDNDTLVVPNNELARHAVLNLSQPSEPHSRVLYVGAAYDAPPNRVIATLQALAQEVPGMPERPAPAARVVGYEDFAVRYELRYPVRAFEDYRRVEGEILRLVWYHFRRQGIEIPFPIRTVHLHRAERRGPPESPAERLERVLRTVDIFRPLSEDERRRVARAFRVQHYATGERILAEGEPGDSFFVVDRGEVEVSKALGGRRQVLARLGEGQFFGEMALLTGEARSASVRALDDVDLLCVDKAGFEQVLVAHPAVAEDISALLAERRDALSRAEGDATQRFDQAEPVADLKQRILARMRAYFGL